MTKVFLSSLIFVQAYVCAMAEPPAANAVRAQAEAIVQKGIDLNDGSVQEEEFYKEAYRLDPTYHKCLRNIAVVYADRREYELAISYLEQYLQYEPESAEALFQLAACYDNLGKSIEASDYYKQYLAASKGSEEAASKSADGADKEKYVDAAKKAMARIEDKSTDPIVAMFQKNDHATAEDIVQALLIPRSRSAFRYGGGTPVFASRTILFEKDKANLLPAAYATLDEAVKALKDNRLGSAKIRIDGHTSTEGTDEHNMDLSRRRAEAVRSYLVSKGVPEEKFEIRAFGEERPFQNFVPDDTDDKKSMLRRVEFENVGKIVGTAKAIQGQKAPQ